MIGIVSQNRFQMMCHTFNCCTKEETNKYFRFFSFTWNVIPVDMLDYVVSNFMLDAVSKYILDGFRTFLLFILFLLIPYRITLELLKLLVLFWRFFLILLWFLLLSLSRGALLTSIALLSWVAESFDWSKFCVFELILEFCKRKIFSSGVSDSHCKQTADSLYIFNCFSWAKIKNS